VIFVHDDVTIGDLFIQEKLTEVFDRHDYAIAGLAGTSDFKIHQNIEIISWCQYPQEACSGAVEHHRPSMSTMMNTWGPTPRRCVVLDGLFLAVDLKKIRHIRFDEQFTFHFYDLDFCLTAHQAGLVLGTVNVYVTHRSDGGYFSQAFREAQAKFRAKWKTGQYRTGFLGTLQEQTGENLHAKSPLSKWQETLHELPLWLPASSWIGHIPFMFLLFKLTKPRIFVELGVDLGASFLTACEASYRFRTETQCVGIDTWRGDEHAGFYSGDDIFERLKQFVAARYPSCALLRQTFDQAVEQFEDSSVDVLHIDGLHTYEAVSHDFSTWLPKLSDRSIVLFHDTEVRERDFGVWKFWSEIKTKYRHFEFSHSFGLGVLLTGASITLEMEDLVEFILAGPDQTQQFQDICKAAVVDMPQRMHERGPVTISESTLMDKLVRQKSQVRPTQAMPRRNELCFCGSGRRYKHCHGKLV
jgi:Methyltransferase domain/Glycosyltransferase like family/SEC-C motif